MINIICFGDSITEAAEFDDTARWTDILQRSLDGWRPGRYRVINQGIGGNTSGQGFDRVAGDVLPYLPGVLLTQFGFNDANVRDWTSKPRVGVREYRDNLQEIYRICLGQGGLCVYIVNHSLGRVTGTQGNNKSYTANFQPYHHTLKELIAHLDAVSIDLPDLMAQRATDVRHFVAADGLHLSEQGNRQYAEMVFAALKPAIAEFGAGLAGTRC